MNVLFLLCLVFRVQFIDPADFLIYSLADGSLVGFNQNAKRCSLASGQTINKSVLTGNLANCIGFIDVNGVSLPNKEVTCSDGTSALEPNNPCTLKSKPWGLGDIFPIVFHNGTVEPATNASKAFFSGESSGGGEDNENDKITLYTSSGEEIGKVAKYKTVNGNRYEYDTNKGRYCTNLYDGSQSCVISYNGKDYILLNGRYFYVDDNNNDILRTTGIDVYYRQPNGEYIQTSGNYTYKYDKDMNLLGYNKSDGIWYEKKGVDSIYVDDDGNYRNPHGTIYYKQSNGNFEHTTGKYTYVYDKDLNLLGANVDGVWFEHKGFTYVRQYANGNYISYSGTIYYKQANGNYESTPNMDGDVMILDNNLNLTGLRKSGGDNTIYYWNDNAEYYYTKDANGNYVGLNGRGSYLKRPDGLYEYSGNSDYVFDENLIPIGPKEM